MPTKKPNRPRRPRGTGTIWQAKGSWYGQWGSHGRTIKRVLGPDTLTGPQAEKRLRAKMAELDAAPPPVGERVTVRQASERHLARLESLGRKPSTLRAYRSLLSTQIGPRIGASKIATLTREDVEGFILGLSTDGLSPKATRNVLGLLHGVCAFAVKSGWALTNPVTGVERPQVEQSRDIRFLDEAELEAVLRGFDEDDDWGRVYHAVILTAALTGLRKGELRGLRWMDIDWQAQRLRVLQSIVGANIGTPKTRRSSRSVPLADRVAGELDRLQRASLYQDERALVFGNPWTGAPIGEQTLLRTFQDACEDAGVRRVRFHDLRHTFGTQMAAAGIPIRTVQAWMGHEHLATTEIYADYAPNAQEVELVNRAFPGVGTFGPGQLSGHLTAQNEGEQEGTGEPETA